MSVSAVYKSSGLLKLISFFILPAKTLTGPQVPILQASYFNLYDPAFTHISFLQGYVRKEL